MASRICFIENWGIWNSLPFVSIILLEFFFPARIASCASSPSREDREVDEDVRLGLIFGEADTELEIEEDAESVMMDFWRATWRVTRLAAISKSKFSTIDCRHRKLKN